ncbi:Lrp/AsnC ligand binding domain-containing protein [Patescibacteria group bacterium]|nr:Lrp/AsnC ligand binding domain-containing protein [Patescibacteria group bacterium]
MHIGFVLIKTASEHEHTVYNKLLKTREVIEVHPLFGEYDLIVKIEAESFEKLGEIIINKIRSIRHVTDTRTLTGTKLDSKHKWQRS